MIGSAYLSPSLNTTQLFPDNKNIPGANNFTYFQVVYIISPRTSCIFAQEDTLWWTGGNSFCGCPPPDISII